MKEAICVEVSFFQLLLFLLWCFFASRVRQSPGKPVTRKRCVLFHCCDGCCDEGTKINDLSSQQREKLSDISGNLVEIHGSFFSRTSSSSLWLYTVSSEIVRSSISSNRNIKSGFKCRKPSFWMFTEIFSLISFRLKTSQLLKTMISLMKVTSYKSEMTTRSTSWRS